MSQDKLTKLARGQPCMVRLESICTHDADTTVLAHFRMAGLNGAGMKPPSLIGAWACHACHSAIDRRSNMDLDRDYVRLCHAEGVMRTQAALIRRGAVRW